MMDTQLFSESHHTFTKSSVQCMNQSRFHNACNKVEKALLMFSRHHGGGGAVFGCPKGIFTHLHIEHHSLADNTPHIYQDDLLFIK